WASSKVLVATSAHGSMASAEALTPAGLATRRRALGLTQRALGELLGVPRNTVARWERGDLRVARPDWLALALGQLEEGSRASAGSARSPFASTLPAELSSFAGREQEVAECCALLLRHERLVTLTGTGGIGKSRLALRVADCISGTFPDG